MAVSDYDSIIFGLDGQPVAGAVTVGNKIIEPYKLWLTIEDKDSGEEFTMHEGYITGNVSFRVKRFASNSREVMFAYIRSGVDSVGIISCYGHISDVEWLRLNYPQEYKKHIKWFSNPEVHVNSWSQFGPDGTDWGIEAYNYRIGKGKTISLKHIKEEQEWGDTWVGITPELLTEYYSWLLEDSINEYDEHGIKWFNCLPKSLPDSYNQGDAFFAKNLGFEIPTAPAGQTSPLIQGLFKQEDK